MSSAASAKHPVNTVTRDVIVINKQGIHARPSASFVKIASRYPCEIWLEKDDERINGKSIMGLLMLAAGPGSRLKIVCIGTQAVTAADELEALFKNRFGEE